jgi:hypothetical protein
MRLKFQEGTDFSAFVNRYTPNLKDMKPEDQERAALAINFIDSIEGDITVTQLKHVLDGTGKLIVEEDGRSLRFEAVRE